MSQWPAAKRGRTLVRFTQMLFAAAVLTPEQPALQAAGEEPRPAEEKAPPEPAAPQDPVALPGGAESLRVFVGRSVLVDSVAALTRVSVTDPAIASATVISPRQVLIHGHQPGAVTLILWDERARIRSLDLRVERDLHPLREAFQKALPQETIEVSESGAAIVLSGRASSKNAGERAVALAQTQAEKVVNLLVEAGGQVLLKVRVAEVNRAAIQDLGLNLFGTGLTLGDANVIGTVTTKQFGDFVGNVGAIPQTVQGGTTVPAPNVMAGGIGNTAEGTPAVFGTNDLLNIFAFLPDRNLGALVKALEQRNLLEILAEPNLLAQNGQEASFLAGGEFPFPVLQATTGGLPGITIQFREFGVRLKFTPTILGDDRISLKVIQEVSSLDFSNALTISGFVIPALSTRRTETQLQLGDGQSFAVAGLIDKRVTEVASKIPGLGDIPIIGKLFRSRSQQRVDSELLVMVTPLLVKPLPPGQEPQLPAFPKAFLDREKFDEAKKGKSDEGKKRKSDEGKKRKKHKERPEAQPPPQ